MQVKNIYGKKINVLGKPLEPDEVIEIDTKKTNPEIKKLIKQNYIEVN